MTNAKRRPAASKFEAKFQPGKAVILTAPSPSTSYGAVFEDDGETGYLYAVDSSRQEQQILDALHIYNVSEVVDRDQVSTAEVRWSADGLKVVLVINAYAHAGFDFVKQRGYCRTSFPLPTAGGFSSEGHGWSDDFLACFS
jgi:hypothetical protein